jgi:hypothetical protein
VKIYHEKINARSYEYRVELHKPNKNEAGLYKCLIANDHGQNQVYLHMNVEACPVKKTKDTPTFIETPKIVSLNNGTLIQMIARYETSNKCQCSWSKKGKVLTGSQTVKIFHEQINSTSFEYRVEISKPGKDTAGLYRCQIKNFNGQMQVYLNLNIDTVVKTKPKEAPTFLEVPKIVSLNNGKLVEMISRYQASEKCYCSWSKKGMSISESQTTKIFHEKINARTFEYRVEIHMPSKNEAGLYKCLIANDHGQNQVYLHMNVEACPVKKTKDAPTFIQVPKIVSLNNGQLVQMIARYQAKEQCYCTWSKKGISLSENEKVQVYHGKINNNSYEYRVEIREPTENTLGLYKCLVGNDNGQNQVYLNMEIKGMSGLTKRNTKLAPTFIDTPKINKSKDGKLIQMIARYQAKEQCHCTWSKKGVPLSESQKVQVFHKKINFNSFEYRVEVREPNRYTAGLYKCLVSNEHGQMQVYLTLDVAGGSVLPVRKTKDAPTFVDTPKITMKNGSVHMIARYQAKEQCHCSWSKKGVSLSESQKVQVFHKKLNINSFEYRVEVREPNRYTAGLYKCMIANDNGQMQVYLTLGVEALRNPKEAPTFEEIPKIITLNNGKLLQMIARYQASKKCTISWSKKGKKVSESQNVKIFHENISSNSFEYRVEIQKPTKDEAGLYKCMVMNDHGQMQVYLHLNIETKATLAKRSTKNAPTFFDTPKIMLLNKGKSIQMIARYQAKEQCYCSWSKKGITFAENKTVKVFHKKINTNCYEYRVDMPEPNRDMSGLYKCLIANDNGQMQVYLNLDHEAQIVKKEGPPTFEEIPKIITLNNGKLVQMIAYTRPLKSLIVLGPKKEPLCLKLRM